MEKESIPNLEVVSDDPAVRRNEADGICATLKCVCLDEFTRWERAFLENMEDAEFITTGQLEALRKIQTKLMDRVL